MTEELVRRVDESTPVRVLVVEDDQATCDVITELLQSEGFNACACYSSEDAIRELDARRFDLLLTDQVMAGMTGVELVERAVEVNPRIRCVVLSGTERPSNVHVTWLRKPISVEALLEAVGESRRARRC